MAMKQYFSNRPPVNRVEQIERGKASAQLSGSAIIVALALCSVIVAMVIVLEVLATMPPF